MVVEIDNGAGQTCIELRVGLAGVELAQHDLAMGPGQFEDAVGEIAVLVLGNQMQGLFARVGSADDDINHRRLFRFEYDLKADRRDGIEHRTVGTGQRRQIPHRLRRLRCVAASEEAGAIGFERRLPDLDTVRRHQVQHPRHFFAVRTRAARAQDRVLRRQYLGLHKQVAESRVRGIGGSRRQHDFGIAGDVDGAPRAGAVGDVGAAQFDIVFRRHHDFGVQLDIVVAAAEFGTPFRENHLVVIRLGQGWLVCGGPERTVGRIVFPVAHVAERTPIVARAILAPARQRQFLPAAVAAAGIADHQVIAAIGQQLDFRCARIGAIQDTHGHLLFCCTRANIGKLGGVGIERGGFGYLFLQQQHRGLEQGRRGEALLHGLPQQVASERKQAHTLVMRHEGLDQGMRLSTRQARRRVVDGFKEAEFAFEPGSGEPLHIDAGRFRRHHQGQH